MSDPILTLKGISKSFPGVRALSDISFDVRPGEVHALLGENGAGKSTLIKIMSGVYQPDAGTITLDGRETAFASPEEAQKSGIATIYQELLLFPELSVAENIFMGHAPKNRFGAIDWRATRERAHEVLASLDIRDLDVRAPVGQLSVGNRQRVEIAKALSHNARILIMDEPTAALTEHDVTRLFGIVRLLRSRGVGVVYISHRLEEVFLLADRVTVLRDGEFVATKAVADTHHDDLIHMMVGRRIDQLFPKANTKVGEIVLELDNVVRAPMTKGVSLKLRAGEIVGVAGLVGSGRSELAEVIFGMTPLEQGTIRIDGKPVKIDTPSDAKHLGIAYVPEDRGRQGLVRPMPISENVSLASLGRVSRRTFIDRNAENALAEESVKQFQIRASGIGQIVGKLSGGNQQKVGLSKWLATEPRILIMDEPTRGIDVGAKAEIHRLMSELASKGMAILMISSELPEVMGMSDRILVMRAGRLVAEVDRAAATQAGIAAAMMSDQTAPHAGSGGVSEMAVREASANLAPAPLSRLPRIALSQELVLLLALIALFVVVGTINPRFVDWNQISSGQWSDLRNLKSIFLGNAYIAVAAIGMSMVIISGNIDISVGSLIGVLATISGTLAVAGVPIVLCWVIPIVVAIAFTTLMGAMVAYLRIPSIVVSLGFLSILKGGLISATGGAWINTLPEGFHLAQMRPLGVPMPIYFMLVLTIGAAIWMRLSATGRSFYAVGGNAEAARLSGINRERTIIKVFAIHGFFVGVAAILFATQLAIIQSTVPPNLELTIITASVVGGVSILGGTGTVVGSTLAAILIAAIGSSLIFINVSPYWLRAVQGVLILLTVLADLWRRARQARRR